MMKNERVYAKVDLDAILWNLSLMKQRLHQNTKIVAVIKADGYGHGALQIAVRLEQFILEFKPFKRSIIQL